MNKNYICPYCGSTNNIENKSGLFEYDDTKEGYLCLNCKHEFGKRESSGLFKERMINL